MMELARQAYERALVYMERLFALPGDYPESWYAMLATLYLKAGKPAGDFDDTVRFPLFEWQMPRQVEEVRMWRPRNHLKTHWRIAPLRTATHNDDVISRSAR